MESALRREFEQTLETSLARVRSTLAPYDRFVETELERLESASRQLDQLSEQFGALRGRIDTAAPSVEPGARSSGLA